MDSRANTFYGKVYLRVQFVFRRLRIKRVYFQKTHSEIIDVLSSDIIHYNILQRIYFLNQNRVST